MKKVFLVMNDPMFCGNCPLAHNKQHIVTKEIYWYCGIAYKTDKDYYYEGIDLDAKNKPDWCPLKPVPDKRNYSGDYTDDYGDGHTDGWNDCIDEIVGVDS